MATEPSGLWSNAQELKSVDGSKFPWPVAGEDRLMPRAGEQGRLGTGPTGLAQERPVRSKEETN